jgi:hypothetical protein
MQHGPVQVQLLFILLYLALIPLCFFSDFHSHFVPQNELLFTFHSSRQVKTDDCQDELH